MSSEVIKFYRGERNKNNVTIEEVWNFSDKELENIHNYIQFLFPIVEPDYWNRDTPKLSEEDIEEFNSDMRLRLNLVTSFNVILNFWGFILFIQGGEITIKKSEDYENKKKNWQTYINHNFLRITRVIHCLNDLGFYNLSDKFHKCIMDVVDENPERFNKTTIDFWNDAMVKNMKGRLYGKYET
jgi:hypothetical protein